MQSGIDGDSGSTRQLKGSQDSVGQIPEPVSLLIWSVFGAAGVGIVAIRRKHPKNNNQEH